MSGLSTVESLLIQLQLSSRDKAVAFMYGGRSASTSGAFTEEEAVLPSTGRPSTESLAGECGIRKHDHFVYVGTYTDEKSKGISAFRLSGDPGTLTPVGLVAQAVNPSFLAVHPSKRLLFAIGEVRRYAGQASGLASAYAIDRETGKLSLLNTVASRGPSLGPNRPVLPRQPVAIARAGFTVSSDSGPLPWL